jgi:hypothetical protein
MSCPAGFFRVLMLVSWVCAGSSAFAQSPPKNYAMDADKLQFTRIEWDAPLRGEDANAGEFDAYNDTVLHARQFTADELRTAGSRDVTFRDLVRPTGTDFQFKLLTIDGRLKRIRRIEPSLPLKAAGLKDLYECYVFPTYGSDPLCLLLTELPPGFEPSMDLNPSRNISFGAYYFKLIQYESAQPNPKNPERNVIRRAPLLISRGLVIPPEPSRDGSQPWREGFFPGLAVLVGGVIALGLGLTAWFRWGDRATKAKIEEHRQQKPFVEPVASPGNLD